MRRWLSKQWPSGDMPYFIFITMTSEWGAIASQITSLTIDYSTIQTQIKENIRAPRHWPLCGEFTGTGEFPAQRASYAENVSIWWRHHVFGNDCVIRPCVIHDLFMKMSWHEDVVRIIAPLWGKISVDGRFPSQRASNVELWYIGTSIEIIHWTMIFNNIVYFTEILFVKFVMS